MNKKITNYHEMIVEMKLPDASVGVSFDIKSTAKI